MQETVQKTAPAPVAAKASWRVILIGLLVTGGLIIAASAWWYLQQVSPAPGLPPSPAAPVASEAAMITAPFANALAQTTMRLSELETELARLKAAAETQASPADAAAITQMDATMRAISGSLDALSSAMTAVNTRLVALEAVQAAQPLGSEAKRMAYALGLRELERALNGSGPFAVELDALARLQDAAADPAIAQLRPLAASGVASRAVLAAQFDAAASAIVRAGAAASEDTGWAGRAYGFVMSLVMIRPTGEREGLDAPSRVARAQLRLEEGDLDAAIRELSQLEGPAAQAAESWLTDARARLTAEQALAQLTAALTAQLSDAANPPAPVAPPPGSEE